MNIEQIEEEILRLRNNLKTDRLDVNVSNDLYVFFMFAVDGILIPTYSGLSNKKKDFFHCRRFFSSFLENYKSNYVIAKACTQDFCLA